MTPDGEPDDLDPLGAAGERTSGMRAARKQKKQRKHWLPAPIRHIVQLLVLALIIEYLVLPQVSGTRKALNLVSHVNPAWVGIGVLLEACALIAYAQLTKSVLPQESNPGFATTMRIQLTTLAVSHCLPGGTAAGSSIGYRLFTQAGVAGSDTGFALATQGLGSAVVLNTILWVALIVSIPINGYQPVYLTAAVVGAVLLIGMGLLVALFTRGDKRAERVMGVIGQKLPFVHPEVLPRLVRQLALRVSELSANRRLLVAAVIWAAANWLLDAASLLVWIRAFGAWIDPVSLLVSYGLANVLAVIPVTPAGLGVVEGVLTSTLVGFGLPRGVAILGVVGYRLVNFWVPIPVGGLSYLSLQIYPPAPDAAGRAARRASWGRGIRRVGSALDPRSRGSSGNSRDGSGQNSRAGNHDRVLR